MTADKIDEQRMNYISRVYNQIYMKDIKEMHHLKDRMITEETFNMLFKSTYERIRSYTHTDIPKIQGVHISKIEELVRPYKKAGRYTAVQMYLKKRILRYDQQYGHKQTYEKFNLTPYQQQELVHMSYIDTHYKRPIIVGVLND